MQMTLNFGAEHMIGYNAENSSGNLSKKYASVIEGLMSFPINFPGTAYYNCLKVISQHDLRHAKHYLLLN